MAEDKVYVKELPSDVDKAGLIEMLEPFGTVVEAKILGNGKGYAKMKSAMEASMVVAALNDRDGMTWTQQAEDGKKRGRDDGDDAPKARNKKSGKKARWEEMEPGLSKTGDDDKDKGKNIGEDHSKGVPYLFFRGLPEEQNTNTMRDLLAEHGTVLACRVVFNDRGKSSRFGFATMEDGEMAQAVVDALNGKDGMKVNVADPNKKPNPKEDPKPREKKEPKESSGSGGKGCGGGGKSKQAMWELMMMKGKWDLFKGGWGKGKGKGKGKW